MSLLMPEFYQKQPKSSFHRFNLVITTELYQKTYFSKKVLLELNKQAEENWYLQTSKVFLKAELALLTLQITYFQTFFIDLFHSRLNMSKCLRKALRKQIIPESSCMR